MYESLSQVDMHERAFLQLYPWEDRSDISLSSYLFLDHVRGKTKKRVFGGKYVSFGDMQVILGAIMEAGGQIANKSRAETEELAKLSMPQGFGRAAEMWDIASDFANAKSLVYKEYVGIEPSSFLDLHKTTVYLEYGIDPFRQPKEKDKADGRKLKNPDDMLLFLGLAALQLNAGASLARLNPGLITDRRIGSELYMAMGDVIYADARRWAAEFRPDLRHLLA